MRLGDKDKVKFEMLWAALYLSDGRYGISGKSKLYIYTVSLVRMFII